MILAFMDELFTEENEVSIPRARAALEANIELLTERELWESDTAASSYLRQWTDEGWFRDMDDYLSMTDASEQALRFARGLSQRAVNTSASHLRIVQDQVQDLATKLSATPEERLNRLEQQRLEIEVEMDNVRAGRGAQLTQDQQKESIRELYQQASILTGDFRRVEDDMRNMDRAMRVEMIAEGVTRGAVLSSSLDYEERLGRTESGSAFFGFHELLQDQNRSMEFRQELQAILASPAGQLLTKAQFAFLRNLVRNLNREGDRVLDVRRRHSQGLRSFVESGAAFDTHAVNRILGDVEKAAVRLKDLGVSALAKTQLALPIGRIEVNTPTSIRLKHPQDSYDTSGVEEQHNTGAPSTAALEAMITVRATEVAARVRDTVRKEGPLTIAGIAGIHPIRRDLEEITALVRIARAVNASELPDSETIIFKDRQGTSLRVTLPSMLMSADLFPDDIEELGL